MDMDLEFFFKDESLIIRKIFFSRNNKNRSNMGIIFERLGFLNYVFIFFFRRFVV